MEVLFIITAKKFKIILLLLLIIVKNRNFYNVKIILFINIIEQF